MHYELLSPNDLLLAWGFSATITRQEAVERAKALAMGKKPGP